MPFDRRTPDEPAVQTQVRFWIGNITLALLLWPLRVKPESVDLDGWESTCGTFACFGGHLPDWPEFRALGVVRVTLGAPHIDGVGSGGSVAHYLFGNPGLFASRQIWEPRPEEMSDHALVSLRLRNELEFFESIQRDFPTLNPDLR